MNTRALIQTIRDNATGSDEYNELLHRCANEIEQFLGGPVEDGGESNETP